MTFSLIIGTLNRKECLMSCLNSLLHQTLEDYEIIIIDQSDNEETEIAIKKLNNQKIKYKHVNYKGLSRARNDALRMATGKWFCLIDDDAFYSEEYLKVAFNNICNRTIISGRIFDTIKKADFVAYNNNYDKRILPIRGILRTCPSAALVFPFSIISDVGMFDERFGVGSVYGAGEETDLILRALKKDYKVKYVSNLNLKHPFPLPKENNNEGKSGKYYEGIGAMYRKHVRNPKLIPFLLEIWIKLLAKQALYRGDRKQKAKMELRGFIHGFQSFKQ